MEPLRFGRSSLSPPYVPSQTLVGVQTTAILAAGGSWYGSFVAGLLVGIGIGFLLGPAVRSWLAFREWADASRQARLTDDILARMERDAQRGRKHEHAEPSTRLTDTRGPWRPSP
jgi:hypothetical protein